MAVHIHTAMLMAAGLGTRMRPLSLEKPKPMIPVLGRPMIDRLIDALIMAGIKRCVVNLHYLADMLEAHLKKRKDIEILFSDERAELLETGGGLAKARPLLDDDPIFVINTDALWAKGDSAPLTELALHFDPNSMDELLLLADPQKSSGLNSDGDFSRLANGQLSWYNGRAKGYIFTGVRIIKPQIYDKRPIIPFSSKRLWEEQVKQGLLYGHILDQFWMNIGDPEGLAEAEGFLTCSKAMDR